jgi:hypothetical protein
MHSSKSIVALMPTPAACSLPRGHEDEMIIKVRDCAASRRIVNKRYVVRSIDGLNDFECSRKDNTAIENPVKSDRAVEAMAMVFIKSDVRLIKINNTS